MHRTKTNISKVNHLITNNLQVNKTNKKCSFRCTKNVHLNNAYFIDNQEVKKPFVRFCSVEKRPKTAFTVLLGRFLAESKGNTNEHVFIGRKLD